MKISTEINSSSRIIGEEKAIEYLARAGFDAWDFSMFAMCGYNWSTKTIVPSQHPLASNGYLTLEADQYLSKYTCENILVGIKALADSAKKLAKMYEEKES